MLLNVIKSGLKGVEVVLMNAGNIRGKRDYTAGHFLLGDLYQELPFENPLAIVDLPDKILQECIQFSRTGDGEKPGFLHANADCEIEPINHKLVKVNGQPLNPDKFYSVAILVHLLEGMNDITPLLQHAKASKMLVPDLERCHMAKVVLLNHQMKTAW